MLTFFLDHPYGESVFAYGAEGFGKAAVGEWQGTGRFLGLCMGVTYPLADGRKDGQTAFAMLGVDPDTGELEAQVCTDGGSIHPFHLEVEGESISVGDRVHAHHGTAATRACKRFCPADSGVEERHEIALDTGQFELCYTIPMYRAGTDPLPRG